MELADVIDRVRPCIVQIAYTITGLEERRLHEPRSRGAVYSKPVGSGFVLTDKGEIVTAKHVLDEIERFAARVPEGGHIVAAGFAYPNAEGRGVGCRANFRVIKYEVVGTDDRNDLALLRLVANPSRPRALTYEAKQGSTCSLVLYGYGSPGHGMELRLRSRDIRWRRQGWSPPWDASRPHGRSISVAR
jgi:S1-C subfamily serine protease